LIEAVFAVSSVLTPNDRRAVPGGHISSAIPRFQEEIRLLCARHKLHDIEMIRTGGPMNVIRSLALVAAVLITAVLFGVITA
jgi:hypothetical protein